MPYDPIRSIDALHLEGEKMEIEGMDGQSLTDTKRHKPTFEITPTKDEETPAADLTDLLEVEDLEKLERQT